MVQTSYGDSQSTSVGHRWSLEKCDQSERDNIAYISFRAIDTSPDVYSLRYYCYRREGIIPVNIHQTFRDRYDEDETAFNCAIKYRGQLHASIRISFLTKNHRQSPSYDAFPDVLDPYLDRGVSMVDPTRFVVSHQASRDMHMLMLRVPLLAVCYSQSTIGLGAVRREHISFYRRVLGGVQIMW